MDALANWILINMAAFGVPILLLVSYFGSLGIPFPITPVIVAAGAFTREGIFDWRLALLACLAGASLADHSEYLLGRWAQRRLAQRFGEKAVWRQAQTIFDHQGGRAVLLTRFWLTPLAPAINVIAGSRYPYTHFLFFDLTGELLWVLLYGGLGYLFAEQWEIVSQAISGFSGLSVGVLVAAWVAYMVIRRQKQAARTARQESVQN